MNEEEKIKHAKQRLIFDIEDDIQKRVFAFQRCMSERDMKVASINIETLGDLSIQGNAKVNIEVTKDISTFETSSGNTMTVDWANLTDEQLKSIYAISGYWFKKKKVKLDL